MPLLALILAAGASGSLKLLAVLPLDASKTEGKMSAAAKASVEEMLRDAATNALAGTGWKVMTSETTLALLEGNNIDATRCEGSCQLETARLMSAEKFIAGSVQYFEDAYSAQIRFIDTKSGEILASTRFESKNVRGLQKEFDKVAAKFFAKAGMIQGASAAPPAPVAEAAPAQAGRVDSKSGLPIVALPGGDFHAGCEPSDTACDAAERPGRDVAVKPFSLLKTEVTLQAYERCVKAGACSEPKSGGNCTWGSSKTTYPINCVDWNQAAKFCAWVGGRLPSGDEWEWAAKSGESRIYPWGSVEPEKGHAQWSTDRLSEVGAHPTGDSKHGVHDLSGNAWEWTSSTMGGGREVRGGGWNSVTSRNLRASHRDWYEASEQTGYIGLRCAF